MDFKEATDTLLEPVDLLDLAERLGASKSAVYQARLAKTASGYRTPPKAWPRRTIQVLEERIAQYQNTIDRLRPLC